jgi:hypothetical protein
VRFATKPEQAMAMLEHAWDQGVPMRSRLNRRVGDPGSHRVWPKVRRKPVW